MSADAEVTKKNWDTARWLLVLILIVVGVVGNQYFSTGSLLYRIIGLLILSIAAGTLAYGTDKGQKFALLLKEARIEIRKVVWPTRQELTQTTLIVVVFVLVVALFLWGLDSLISFLVSGVIG